MTKPLTEYQQIKQALLKQPGMADMVRLDMDLPTITRADLFLILWMPELAEKEAKW